MEDPEQTAGGNQSQSNPNLAERITALSNIDQEISSLLTAAASTVSALLPPQTSTESTPEARKEALRASAEEYLRLVKKIEIGLRREVAELENAQMKGGTGGGLGLDKVERGREVEAWKEARRWVEEVEQEWDG